MLKIKRFKTLTHIGTLNPADKGRVGHSHEGSGLSVSTCPNAWEQICKLGGLPWWTLTKPGHQFLDWYGLSGKTRKEIHAWGAAQGLVVEGPVWQLSWYDSEQDEAVFVSFPTEAAAKAEMGDDRTLSKVPAQWHATAALAAQSGHPDGEYLDLAFVSDMLAVAYARAQGLDGVFWREVLDVYAYSAPRAVILLEKLGQWTITPANAGGAGSAGH